MDLCRYRPPQKLRASILRDAQIDLVLDVGANRGQYGLDLRKWGYSSTIVSFEPLEDAFTELSRLAEHDPDWTCHRLALGQDESVITMNRAKNTWSSSILPITSAHTRADPDSIYVGTEDVMMKPLDSLELPVARSALLKLDVQGYELQVLRGAMRSLRDIQLIECELSVVELYEGGPRLLQMLNEIDAVGFDLVALEPGFYDPRTGQRLQFDGFFGRR